MASSLGRGPPGGLGCRPRTASRRSGGSRHQHCDNTLSPDVCRALCWPCVRIVLVKKLIGAFQSHTGNPNELLGQPIAYVCVFPVALMVKNPSAKAGDARDASSIHGSGRSPGEGTGDPLQCSCWRIPWTEEPGGLQSTGSQRVRYN